MFVIAWHYKSIPKVLEKIKDDENTFVLDQYIGILLEKTFFCTKLIRGNDKIYFLQQINNEHFMLLIIVFNIRVGIFAQGTATTG